MKNICEIKKQSLSDLLNGIKDKDAVRSAESAYRLMKQANEFGLSSKDYLDLAVEANAEDATKEMAAQGLSGYEMAKVALGLPTKNDFANQITLAQASDTFATYKGSRFMFKYVVDDMLRWKTRQDQVQKLEDLISGSRTVPAREMIRQIVDLNGNDASNSFDIAEMGQIPFRNVKTSDVAVKFGKIGSGLRFSYEFAREASLDVLTPFVARIAREKELEKINRCTAIMINGDGTSYHAAAPEYNQSALDSAATAGKISFKGLWAHIINEAKKGVTIDHIAGNWDAYLQWLQMFPVTANVTTDAEELAKRGLAPAFRQMSVFQPIQFVLDTAVPANKLLCYTKAETIEELVLSGSQIQEEERSIRDQTIMYTNTEDVGFSMIFGDTRSLYNYGA